MVLQAPSSCPVSRMCLLLVLCCLLPGLSHQASFNISSYNTTNGTTVQPITLPLFMFSSGLLLTNSTNYTIASGNATLTRSAASGRRLMANPDALPAFNILDRFYPSLIVVGTPKTTKIQIYATIFDTGSTSLVIASNPVTSTTGQYNPALSTTSSQAVNLANRFVQANFGIGAARGQYFNDVIGIGAVNLVNQAFLADDSTVPLMPPAMPRPAGNILFSVLGLGFQEEALLNELGVFYNLASQNLIPSTDLTVAPSGLNNANPAAFLLSFVMTKPTDASPNAVPGGKVTLGGFDATVFTGQISCANVLVASNRWEVALDSVISSSAAFPSIGGPGKTQNVVIIDSGSTGIVLPPTEFPAALTAIGASTTPATAGGVAVCNNPIPCSTFRNTATPLPVFKFRIGGREYTMTEEEYIVKFPVGPPPVFPGQTADICCSQFQNFGLPEGLYILGDVFIAKYPSIFDTTPSNVIVPQTLPSGPRVCFGGSVPAVVSLSNVVFTTTNTDTGEVSFTVSSVDPTPPTVTGVTVTFTLADGTPLSVVTLADQPTMKTFTGTDKSASITYTVAVPAYGSITATVTITVGGNFVLDTFTSPASISFTNQASTLITDVSIQKGTNLLKPTRQTVQANVVFESPSMPPPPADLLIITQPVTTQPLPTLNTKIPSFPVKGTVALQGSVSNTIATTDVTCNASPCAVTLSNDQLANLISYLEEESVKLIFTPTPLIQGPKIPGDHDAQVTSATTTISTSH